MFKKRMFKFINASSKYFSSQQEKKVLVTGCGGQVGSALVPRLYEKYGVQNVLCTDVTNQPAFVKGQFTKLDVSYDKDFKEVANEYKPNIILHLAAILSASGEKNPHLAVKVNIGGSNTALEIAKDLKSLIYIPSTIAVFGPDASPYNTPQNVPLNPTTVYGITKVYMENMGNYYNKKYGVDFRSLRYPGVISPMEYESHGTTDYASEIFFSAFKNKEYKICLAPERALPMVYLDDALEGTLKLIDAENAKLNSRVYNMAGLSFTCQELTNEIKKHFKDFKYKHEIDFRDKVAQSWPRSINDKESREDWGWCPLIDDVSKLTHKMISTIRKTYNY